MSYEDYQRTYRPGPTTGVAPRRKPRFGTSTKEVVHLVVATVVLSLALYLWFEKQDGLFTFDFGGLGVAGKIGLALSVTASGFILHELGHKFTAQHFGHWSEFRASPIGLGLALVVVWFLGLIIALPGATWHTASNRSENGKVSAMGPLVNIFVMLAAFPFTLAEDARATMVGNIAIAVVLFNGILAIVNLLPIGPLDGRKVLRWNPIFYVALVALTIGVIFWTGIFQTGFYAPQP